MSIKNKFHNSHRSEWRIGITLQHHLACKGAKGCFDGVEGFVHRGNSNLQVPIRQVSSESIFRSCHSSENDRLIGYGAIVFPGNIVPGY